MGDGGEAWAICEALGSRIKIYPWCMNSLIEAHSLWWDSTVSINVGKRDLVLPQLNIVDFVYILYYGSPYLLGRVVGGVEGIRRSSCVGGSCG